MVLPFDSLPHPLVIAHRGSMALAPENTLYAFDLAIDAGADVLEMDVHPSADGAIMVIHDATVDRTSNGTGLVEDLSYSALQKLDFAWKFSFDGESFPLRGQGITIPTLQEVFERFPERHFSIDIKAEDTAFAAEVVKLILKQEMRDSVILGSFHPRLAELLRDAIPPLHVAADRPQGIRLLLSSMLHLPLRSVPAAAYMLPDRLRGFPVATRALIAATHRIGRRCYFWTVDEEPTMRRLLDMGADGLVTNRPDLLSAAIREAGLRLDA